MFELKSEMYATFATQSQHPETKVFSAINVPERVTETTIRPNQGDRPWACYIIENNTPAQLQNQIRPRPATS